jgi:hypothetical protein
MFPRKCPEQSKRRRVVNGRVEKFCNRCSSWVPLEQCVPQKDCYDQRAPRCRPCQNARWELNKMRREERLGKAS